MNLAYSRSSESGSFLLFFALENLTKPEMIERLA